MNTRKNLEQDGGTPKRSLSIRQRCGLMHACLYMVCCKCICCKKGSKESSTEDDGAVFETSVLILGCHGSGKSTLLHQFSQPPENREALPTGIVPTDGFSIKQVKYKNNMISFWEVGGTPQLRKYWHRYATTTFFQVLVFVVDVSEAGVTAIGKSISELKRFIDEVKAKVLLRRKTLLVLLNKADAVSTPSTPQEFKTTLVSYKAMFQFAHEHFNSVRIMLTSSQAIECGHVKNSCKSHKDVLDSIVFK